MSARDPKCVFVADNDALADAVVKLLASAGIASEAVAPPPKTESEPITGMTEMVTPDEIEIRVLDATQVTAAKDLLMSAANAAAIRSVREKRANRTGTISAKCEDCGKSSEWPASAMGTTETCPHCGQYMDIPDPDDDWSDVDIGEDEDEETKEGEKK
jgi:hypothetical protein